MKKITALLMFTCLLATLPLRADVIWQELFNYADGSITNTSAQVWTRHSGSASPSDAIVSGHRLQVSATVSGGNLNGTGGSPMSRQDDIHRNYVSPYTNSQQVVYASFILNCTNLPGTSSTYFAHFYANSSTFYGRLYATNGTLPNTYRLLIAGGAGTATIYPVDMAVNQDYQVVIAWDPVSSYQASLWIDPVSSSDFNVQSHDTVSSPIQTIGYGFRQASSFGNWFCTISNLLGATTFDEASTNVWASNSIPPSIVINPKPSTNFVGTAVTLTTMAAGQGLGSFYYQWKKNGANITNPNGNTNVFTIATPDFTDAGTYSVTVSNLVNGQFATSAGAFTMITNGPPIITVQPVNQSAYAGKTLSVSVTSLGTPPLAYAWTRNNAAITDANVDFSTTNTATLVINNFGAGNTNYTYKCTIANSYGSTNSAAVTLSLLIPQTVKIDTLRGMVDSTFFLPTNTTIFYTVTNAVVYTREVTNTDGSVNGGPFTAAPNAEFYIQDDTGGIAVFVNGGATTAQPRQGDIVNVTGPIGNFNSLLQFNMVAADGSQTVTVTGHTNTLPTPTVLPLSFTNGVGFISVSNVIRKYEGRYVTLQNVFFQTNGNFVSGTYIVTNFAGDSFRIFLNAACANVIGKPIPQFARAVSGPMGYFNTTTATDRSTGFELDPSTIDDILAGPNAPTGTFTGGGATPTIHWTVQPGVPYSVLWATNVEGPYTSIATGLTFPTTAGTYTDPVNTNLPASFYQITSP